LFLVTMIVALGVGWWVDHRRVAAAAQHEVSKEREYRRTLIDIKWPVPGLEGYKRIWGEPREPGGLPTSSAPAQNTPNP